MIICRLTILALICLSLGSCGNLFLKLSSSEATRGSQAFQLDSKSVFNDLKSRCGFTMEEASNTDNALFALKLKSLPIVVKGTESDIDFEVTLEATAGAESKGGKSTQTTDVQIKKINATSKGVVVSQAAIDKFIKPTVTKMLKQTRNNATGIPLPQSTILTQYKEEGQYKGVFCAVGFGLGTSTTGEEDSEVVYSKPLPTAINPKAAAATYELELGESKVFNSVVTVRKAKKDWLKQGSEVPVTVTVRKISPDISKLDWLPKDMTLPALKSDVAYEITVAGTEGVAVSKFGMTKRSVFYVDTAARAFSALVIESDQESPDNKNVKTPPIVLIPEE